MGMMSCAGASSAAGEIKWFIKKELLTKPELSDETREYLEKVVKRCEDIEASADSGWY